MRSVMSNLLSFYLIDHLQLFSHLFFLCTQVKRRNSEESSTQWTTGIAEIQLPIEYAFNMLNMPYIKHLVA